MEKINIEIHKTDGKFVGIIKNDVQGIALTTEYKNTFEESIEACVSGIKVLAPRRPGLAEFLKPNV
jgi:hypothetical protein